MTEVSDPGNVSAPSSEVEADIQETLSYFYSRAIAVHEGINAGRGAVAWHDEDNAARLRDLVRKALATVEAERDVAQGMAKGLGIALDRIRAVWPHIEVPDGPGRFLHGKRALKDPGSPTCLRCKIEEAING